MTIETKLSIDQHCWFIRENRAQGGRVDKIHIVVEKDGYKESYGPSIVYDITAQDGNGTSLSLKQYDVFPTKEDLLKSL